MRRYVRAYGATRADAPIADTIGPLSGEPDGGERDAEPEREPHAGDAVLGRALRVARADAAGDGRGRAVGEEVEDPERHAQDGAGHAEPAERPGAEVPDDRGVGQHVERLGRERAERRDREPQDLAVVRGRRPKLSHPAYSIRLMDAAPPIRFAELARRIGAAARAAGLGGAGVPHAAAPLRSPAHDPPAPGRPGGGGPAAVAPAGRRRRRHGRRRARRQRADGRRRGPGARDVAARRSAATGAAGPESAAA